MLADATIQPIIAVKDINEGKRFYGDTLGLPLVSENPGAVTYKSGSGTLFVYESAENAGTNKATAASWEVDDLKATIEELKAKGITFEHYDLPGSTREGDIHIMGDEKAAWFKDPDGNILAVGTTSS